MTSIGSVSITYKASNKKNKARRNVNNNHNNNKTSVVANSTPDTTPAASGTGATTAATTAVAAPPPTPSLSNSQNACCLICVEPIRFHSIGPCNHNEICSVCSLRWRALYKDLACPFCKMPVDEVVFTSNPDKKFQEFDLPKLPFDQDLKIYFDDPDYQREVKRLMAFTCVLCSVPSFSSISQLQQHVRKAHSLVYCDLCLEGRKVFLHQQKLYTTDGLKVHQETGDPTEREPRAGSNEKPFKGHPPCQFCDGKRFYGDDQLYEHLHQNHEQCFICTKDGILYQYYRNYRSLQQHFEKNHYLCPHEECLRAHFIVFKTANELKAHEAKKHFDNRKMSKAEERQALALNIDITFRRPGESQGGLVLQEDDRPRHNQPRPTPSSSTSSSSTPSSSSTAPKNQRKKKNAGHQNNNIVAPTPVPLPVSSEPQPASSTSLQTPTTVPARTPSPQPPTPKTPPPSKETTETKKKEKKKEEDSGPLKVELRVPTTKEELTARNSKLIDLMKVTLGDESKYAEFKKFSSALLRNTVTPKDYYSKFMELFSEVPNRDELFLELVSILPDESKRNALAELHEETLNWKRNRKLAKKERQQKQKGQAQGQTQTQGQTQAQQQQGQKKEKKSTPQQQQPLQKQSQRKEKEPEISNARSPSPATLSTSVVAPARPITPPLPKTTTATPAMSVAKQAPPTAAEVVAGKKVKQSAQQPQQPQPKKNANVADFPPLPAPQAASTISRLPFAPSWATSASAAPGWSSSMVNYNFGDDALNDWENFPALENTMVPPPLATIDIPLAPPASLNGGGGGGVGGKKGKPPKKVTLLHFG